MSTPNIQMETLFVLNDEGRITSTREPGSSNPCPTFSIIRSSTHCVWGVRADVSEEIANELNGLARQEPPVLDVRAAPVYATQYLSLVDGQISSGPTFTFPQAIANSAKVVSVEELKLLKRHFRGWSAEEIAERSPLLAIVEDGHAVSLCFCARRSEMAAEAGLETAKAFRGRGLGPQVTAAWAMSVRASGRTPLYSTSWDNEASLAVARKLGLVMYASDWNLFDEEM